jgi:hypothetical protein
MHFVILLQARSKGYLPSIASGELAYRDFQRNTCTARVKSVESTLSTISARYIVWVRYPGGEQVLLHG